MNSPAPQPSDHPQQQERTSFDRFLDRIKPKSAAVRTTVLVTVVVCFSLFTSILFFWRTLYLPEIQQHARYLAIQLDVIHNPNFHISYKNQNIDTDEWLKHRLGVEYITDPTQYPDVQRKWIADIFTSRIENRLAQEIQVKRDDVTVYFKFKPSPTIWVQTPDMHGNWLKEPLNTYANYSIELIIAWLVGIPLFSAMIILTLVRQLNRPLKRLQNAARAYSQTGRAPYLEINHGPLEIRQVNQAFNHMVLTLEQAEKDRKIMLAGISHDLRTPLTRIRLTAEMLPDEFLREGLVYDVDDMDAILSQFISYMRDGSDEDISETNINSLLQELIIQFQPLDIRFEPQHLPNIMARSLSLKRLVGNLINNAKRYGAEPIDIHASIQANQLHICVSDHGEGVPEEQIHELLQPFVRGNAARTIQGSGLGLAIVKRIVDLHQGKIKLKNKTTGGFEVTIILPVTMPEHD
ncbi:ATP-binding protein [Acinetobacter rathckeae]|uniref:ATP-binding protein n=1 Tax=Acinetobacter rathckeae TaxID=2605272 RepID=UPI0018A28DED|nr:ATP-binding protein [Acinetobacter rathckeae]MBF7688684.1 HAMP domain-containing protein [Acinetobacter rathckeae]MBF7696077.1 HAMP domain-containing protein [Acinetobacter rathckeae]